MPEELSALDTTFLELEQQDACAHMHIGALLVFEPEPGASGPSLDDLQRRLATRVAEMPRFRQRLSTPSTGGLHRPHWVDDDGFDVARHIDHAALPAPGTEQELLDWAGKFFSRRLDRRVPLWEVALVDGLADGRWALATKLHHCVADGIGALGTATLFEDEPAPPSRNAAPPAKTPSEIGALLHGGLGMLRHPKRTFAQAESLAALIVGSEVVGSPASSINVPIGPGRRIAVAHSTLAEISHIRRTAPGTLNDVVLTAVTSGLRDLLLARGEEPPKAGLRAMVPVSVRDASGSAMGNRISSRFYNLPVGEPDLASRHIQVFNAGRRTKRGRQGAGAATMLGLAEHLPPIVHQNFAQSLFGTRLFNVTVTNVPGPRHPGSTFGSSLQEIVPIVPLASDHALGIAVISYGDRLTFSVNADRESVPDVDIVVAGIRAALSGLADNAPRSLASVS